MTRAVLGVIGGSGVYGLPGLEGVREERISTPWGEPSDVLRIGTIGRTPVVFLPRHGRAHRYSPSEPARARMRPLRIVRKATRNAMA